MKEWSIIFYASATICVFAVIIFISFGSSEVQSWNSPPRIPSSLEDVMLEDVSSSKDAAGPSSQSTILSKKEKKTKHDTSPSETETGM